MGLMGALAGAGRGMQGYAQTMRQNQMMNWQAQQDKAKHERQVNLENLRAQNQRQLAEEGRDFQAEQSQLGREHQQGILDQEMAFKGQRQTERYDAEKELIKERATAEIAKQEQLLTQAKQFSEGERQEKAKALEEMLMADGELSPMDELKIIAISNGLDMRDIFGSQKPMTADMVKNIDAVLQTNEAYINADAATKMQLIRDAYQELSGGSGGAKRVLTPEALARAKANPEALTPEDIAIIPPEQLQEIFKGTSRQPGPSRAPSTNMSQGQQYMRDTVGGMSITKGLKSGYGALQNRFQRLREDK